MSRQTTLKTGAQVANEAALQISDLQSGKVTPITTGISHLNVALMGGLLPGSVVTIAGYSYHGKSYELEKIQRHITQSYDDVIMLNAAWELEGFKIISRDLSFQMKKSVKDILFNKPVDEDLETFKKVFDGYRREGLFFQPEPVTSDQFEEDVMWLVEEFPEKRIVVCIDNLENILVDKGTQKDCMDKMLYRINVLKKRHKFISFIVLNQLNNDIIKRMDNLKGHRPVQSDLYGTGQLFKISDVVLIKVMPSRFGIDDKFMVFGKKMYRHLSEFVLPSSTKTTSFDPFGKAFYFYLKARESDKDFQTIYATEMFSRKEMGMEEVEDNPLPVFDAPKIPLVEIFNTKAMKAASNNFDEKPF